MAKSALVLVDLASPLYVAIQFRKVDETATWKRTSSYLILGEPLRISN